MARGDEALSSVVGIFLVIVIAVALAATVLFMVNRVADRDIEDAPDIGFEVDETQNTLRVSKTPAGDEALDWHDDLRLSGSCTPTLNGGAFPSASGVMVTPGDLLECPDGTNLTISSSPSLGDAVLIRASF